MGTMNDGSRRDGYGEGKERCLRQKVEAEDPLCVQGLK